MEDIEKDKQLKKTIKEIINGINDLFDKNLGKKTSIIRNKKDIIDYTFNEIKSTDLYNKFRVEDTYTSEKDILDAFNGFSLGFEYAHYQNTTGGKIGLLEYSKERINDLFRVSPNSFLIDTPVYEYKTALSKIVKEVIKRGKSNDVQLFYKTIPESDLLSLRQQLYKLTLLIPKFYRQEKNSTYKTVEEYLNLYDEAAGCFETYLKISYCIEKILENKVCSFQATLNTDAYTVKNYLRNNNKNYCKLVEPFKTVIWNAIKHTKVTRDPKNKKIDFNANNKHLSYTQSEFMKLTKNLYAALIIISKFYYALLLELIELQLSKGQKLSD